jgi:hypothetical protein
MDDLTEGPRFVIAHLLYANVYLTADLLGEFFDILAKPLPNRRVLRRN